MKKTLLHIAFQTTVVFLAVGQVAGQFRKEEDEDGFLYRTEFVAGVNFNTNGGLIGGAMFKYAKAITPNRLHSFSLELVNIKHPKERRLQNFNTGGTFIPGKANFLFVARPQYGQELILFKKAREQGVQVNFLAAVGPSIGFVAPYLIEYRYGNGISRIEQYNEAVHTNFQEILGTGSFTESLSRSKLALGGAVKTSVSFEFGTFRNNVTGFEAGLQTDIYPNEIVIIPLSENRRIYTSIFLTFFFGIRN